MTGCPKLGQKILMPIHDTVCEGEFLDRLGIANAMEIMENLPYKMLVVS